MVTNYNTDTLNDFRKALFGQSGGGGYEITSTECPLRLFYLRYYTKF